MFALWNRPAAQTVHAVEADANCLPCTQNEQSATSSCAAALVPWSRRNLPAGH